MKKSINNFKFFFNYLQTNIFIARDISKKEGEKLSENSLIYIINKVFKQVPVMGCIHQIRHLYATVLLNHDAKIADVIGLLGHTCMATTQIYIKFGSALKLQNYHKVNLICLGKK